MEHDEQQPEPTEGGQPAPPPPPPASQQQPSQPPQVPEPMGTGSLRSIQTLITVSIVCGPVSMIIGGVFLSLVAIVCAIVALVKVRRLVAQGGGAADMALQTMQRQAMVGIGIGVVAFGFNAVSLALVLPAFIEAMQSGDYAALLDGSGAASSASDAGSSTGKGSVWG